MKQRDNKTLLLAQAKKNPVLQSLIAADLSIEEISKLPQAKWIRDGLIRIKEEVGYANLEDYVLTNLKDSFNEDFTGTIIKWTGDEMFVFFGKTELLINTNDLMFKTDKGIWLDTVFTDKIDDRLNNCLEIKTSKFSEYKAEVLKNINEKHSGTFKAEKEDIITKKWTEEYPSTE